MLHSGSYRNEDGRSLFDHNSSGPALAADLLSHDTIGRVSFYRTRQPENTQTAPLTLSPIRDSSPVFALSRMALPDEVELMSRALSHLCLIIALFATACKEKTATIEGVVTDVAITPAQSFHGNDHTLVTFNDGRVRSFAGVSPVVFQKGKLNVISYFVKRNYIDDVVVK